MIETEKKNILRDHSETAGRVKKESRSADGSFVPRPEVEVRTQAALNINTPLRPGPVRHNLIPPKGVGFFDEDPERKNIRAAAAGARYYEGAEYGEKHPFMAGLKYGSVAVVSNWADRALYYWGGGLRPPGRIAYWSGIRDGGRHSKHHWRWSVGRTINTVLWAGGTALLVVAL